MHSAVNLPGIHSSIEIRRPAPGIVVLVISGSDVGEHGDAPFAEVSRDVARGPIELFVDARASRGASLEVSGDWAMWLCANRERVRTLHMATGSRFVRLTADFVRRFCELGDAMQIYTDPVAFEGALNSAVHAARS